MDIIILDPAASCLEKLPSVVKLVVAKAPPPPQPPLEFSDVSGSKYDKRVPCPHCGQKFIAGYLRQHVLIHSDIKPYGCSYCSFRSRWPHALKLHEQKLWCKFRSKPPGKVKLPDKNHMNGRLNHMETGDQLCPEKKQHVNMTGEDLSVNPEQMNPAAKECPNVKAPDENVIPQTVKLASENPSFSSHAAKQPTPEGHIVHKRRVRPGSITCPEKLLPAVKQVAAKHPLPPPKPPLEFPNLQVYKSNDKVPCTHCSADPKTNFCLQCTSGTSTSTLSSIQTSNPTAVRIAPSAPDGPILSSYMSQGGVAIEQSWTVKV